MNRALMWHCLAVITLVIFNFAVTNMASLYILGDLGGSPMTASYTIAFFGVGNALSMPLAPHIIERFDIKRFMMWLFGLFIVASVITGLAPNYPWLVMGRFLQGLFSGALLMMSFLVVGRVFQKKDLDKFGNYCVLIIMTASVFGASYGGTVAYFLHWRYIFVLDTLILLTLDCVLIKKLTIPLQPKADPGRFDIVGYVSYALSLLSISIFLILGQELDWYRSSFLRVMMGIALITTPFWLVWNWMGEKPAIQLRLLRKIPIIFALIQFGILFACYFGLIIMLALWLHLYVKYDINWVSVLLGLMAAVTLFVMIVIDKIKEKRGMLALILALFLFALSSFLTSNFNAHVNFGRIALSRVIAGVGLALFLPPIVTLLTTRSKPEETPFATTWLQMFRVLGSGLGSSLFSTLWQRRYVFYYSRLGEQITPYSTLTEEKIKSIEMFDLSPKMSLEELNQALQVQSQSLALNDSFFVMGWILVGLLVLACLYSRWQNKLVL